jgi:homoserine dehydrogenase
MKTIKIGLFGFGCVGQGLYHTLNHSTGFKTRIEKIVVKNREKERPIAKDFFSFDKNAILENNDINVVVELIDDAVEAFRIVSTALQKGKNVVTANKKMLAQNLEILLELARKNSVSLLYEASACGSIPIIRTLEEYFDNEEISKISGIFNGTTNYILTKIKQENIDFLSALQSAQQAGFAESNPISDIDGFDALYKTIIISLHSFGNIFKEDEIFRTGISKLKTKDIDFAQKNNLEIKLVPTIQKINQTQIIAYVIPKFLSTQHPLSKVEQEYNAVIAEGKFSGEQIFIGKGAGSLPTGAAVLSDISALSFDYAYEYKKNKQNHSLKLCDDYRINLFASAENKEALDRIQFENIEEVYQSENYYYKIGKISIANLKKINQGQGTSIFLAELD